MSTAASILFTVGDPAGLPPEALRFQLDWYLGLGDWELILVEQGREPRLVPEAVPPGVTHRFVPNPGPFNQGWGFNVGARIATGATLFFVEAGVLVNQAAMVRALKVCRTQAVAADLFHRLIPLDAPQEAALRGGRVAFEQMAVDAGNVGEYPGFCAGACAIDRQLFERVGGFDERLLAPALSVEGMALKLERSGGVLARFDNSHALRLAVESPPPSPDGRQLLQESARQSPSAFHFTCEVQRQLMGNGEKFALGDFRKPGYR